MEESLQRIERTLAMILVHDMKDAPQAEKALALSKAGFSSADIATFLETSSAVVNQQLYAIRKTKSGKPRSKSAGSKRSLP
jgi:hypothetical protein